MSQHFRARAFTYRAAAATVAAMVGLASMLGRSAMAAPAPLGTTPLPAFNGPFDDTGAGSYTGANAEIPAGANAFRAWHYNRNLTVSPALLLSGGTAVLSTHITANSAALGGGTVDPFPTVAFGFMSEQGQAYNIANPAFISRNEIFGPVAGGNAAFPDHDGEAILHYQSNTQGSGVAWNNRFFDGSGNFVFGVSPQGGGYPQDNSGQTAAAIFYSVDLTATIFSNNTYQLAVKYYDVDGNPLVNLTGLSPAANPQLSSIFTLPHASSFNYFPELRIFEDTNALSGWAFNVSNTELVVVPEPASLGLLAAGGLLILRRKRLA